MFMYFKELLADIPLYQIQSISGSTYLQERVLYYDILYYLLDFIKNISSYKTIPHDELIIIISTDC